MVPYSMKWPFISKWETNSCADVFSQSKQTRRHDNVFLSVESGSDYWVLANNMWCTVSHLWSVCILACSLSLAAAVKVLLQEVQANGRSPVWVRRWSSRSTCTYLARSLWSIAVHTPGYTGVCRLDRCVAIICFNVLEAVSFNRRILPLWLG